MPEACVKKQYRREKNPIAGIQEKSTGRTQSHIRPGLLIRLNACRLRITE